MSKILNFGPRQYDSSTWIHFLNYEIVIKLNSPVIEPLLDLFEPGLTN